MRDSKFIKHPCRIIATPVTGACVCACGGTRSQSDWCNSLMLSHACGLPPQCPLWPLSQTRWAFNSFFTTASSRLKWLLWSELGKLNRMVEEVFSKCTVFTFLCLTLTFFFFPFFVKFSIIMGTSVQKKFFFLSYVRTFHRWTFKQMFSFAGKCKENFQVTVFFFFFFKCFVRQNE